MIKYTEDKERSLKDSGDIGVQIFPSCAYYSIVLQPFVAPFSQPKALVSFEDYPILIIINIPVKIIF
jgi:hypothetical protein